MAVATLADGLARTPDSALCHEVVHLREWGTDRIHVLPRAPFPDCLIGTSAAGELHLTDLHAARHARLRYRGRHWWIRDLGSAYGLRQDGVRCMEFLVEPGGEIGVGATTLIAESPHSIALREFCGRMLGWTRGPAVVDHALRAIRLAITRRAALVLCGEAELILVAYALHRRSLGVDAPFVACDPRRQSLPASVRSPANHNTGMVALEAAAWGTVCVNSVRSPRDLAALIARLHEPDPPAQLVVCLSRSDRGLKRGVILAGHVPIEVPSLRDRASELPRIVEEYAAEAMTALHAPAWAFAASDLQWVIEHAATSLDEIEKATLRVVALNMSLGNYSAAAERLGMAQPSLARWLRFRPYLRLASAAGDRAPHGATS